MAEEGASSAFQGNQPGKLENIESEATGVPPSPPTAIILGWVGSLHVPSGTTLSQKIMIGCVLIVNQNGTYHLGQSCTWRVSNFDRAKTRKMVQLFRFVSEEPGPAVALPK